MPEQTLSGPQQEMDNDAREGEAERPDISHIAYKNADPNIVPRSTAQEQESPPGRHSGASSGGVSGQEEAQDASSAPESNNVSQIPGDTRPPNQLQPPFKEQY